MIGKKEPCFDTPIHWIIQKARNDVNAIVMLKNVELIEDKKIVQTWRSEGENWPKGHYSTITLIFELIDEGTLIKFTHVDVPEGSIKFVKEGWDTYYWDPLKKLLEK